MNNTDDVNPDVPEEKKAYQTPEATRLGTLEEQTRVNRPAGAPRDRGSS